MVLPYFWFWCRNDCMLRINLDELFVNRKTTAIINDIDTVIKELTGAKTWDLVGKNY